MFDNSETETIRPRLDLSKEEQEYIENQIPDYNEGIDYVDIGKKEAYSIATRAGLNIVARRNKIRDIIIDFCEDQKPKHKERVEALKEAYDIKEVEWVTEGARKIELESGNEYEVVNIAEIRMFNGEQLDKDICPECGSDDYDFNPDNTGEWDSEKEEITNGDGPSYTCNSCGEGFNDLETRRVAPEDEVERVREYCSKYQNLWDAVMSRLDYILEKVFGRYNSWTGDWTNPGQYRFDNGFQSIHISMWASTYNNIRFRVNNLNSDYEDIRTPVETAGMEVTEDYERLLEEIHIVNDEADKISPLIIDSHGAYSEEPQVIEVWGVEEEDLTLPAYKIGYELETGYNLPENEEIPEEHQDEDAKPISVIRITNDKPVVEEDQDE